MYRVSTSQLAQSGIDAINKNQATMNDLMNQISSGLRTDLDPVEKAQQLSYSVKISNNAQNIRNGETVLPGLTSQETALSSMSEKLIQLQEAMTSAQNPATFDAASLKEVVTGLKSDILDLANTKDSEGNYLFAGYKTQTQAFSDLSTYNGDQGVREVRIGDNSVVNVNITGNNVITKNITDAFSKIENFLNGGSNDKSMIDSVQGAISDISTQQSIVAGSINKIDDFKSLTTSINLQDQTRLNEIQGADLPSLISQLAQAKTASEASLKSYSLIQGLSLFDYI